MEVRIAALLLLSVGCVGERPRPSELIGAWRLAVDGGAVHTVEIFEDDGLAIDGRPGRWVHDGGVLYLVGGDLRQPFDGEDTSLSLLSLCDETLRVRWLGPGRPVLRLDRVPSPSRDEHVFPERRISASSGTLRLIVSSILKSPPRGERTPSGV